MLKYYKISNFVTVQCENLRYHRIEVLGALASVLSSWLVTGILVYEAIQRIFEPVKVNGKGGIPGPRLSVGC